MIQEPSEKLVERGVPHLFEGVEAVENLGRMLTVEAPLQDRDAGSVLEGERLPGQSAARQRIHQDRRVLAADQHGHSGPGDHDAEQQHGELHRAEVHDLDEEEQRHARHPPGDGSDDPLHRGLGTNALYRGERLVQNENRAAIDRLADNLIDQLRHGDHPEDGAGRLDHRSTPGRPWRSPRRSRREAPTDLRPARSASGRDQRRSCGWLW